MLNSSRDYRLVGMLRERECGFSFVEGAAAEFLRAARRKTIHNPHQPEHCNPNHFNNNNRLLPQRITKRRQFLLVHSHRMRASPYPGLVVQEVLDKHAANRGCNQFMKHGWSLQQPLNGESEVGNMLAPSN